MQETAQEKISNKLDFINALKQDFATTANMVYINSLDREIALREVKVSEQKTFSRIAIENEQRKDIIYDAQCQLVNNVCLTEGFDVYGVTEFDRTKLLMAMYQSNMFKNEVTFKCKECGTDNKYKLDFRKAIRELDKFDLSPKKYEFENSSRKFEFTLNYPMVKTVSEFYRRLAPQYRTMTKLEMEAFNQQVNLDYINLFIQKISYAGKDNGKTTVVDMNEFTIPERQEIMSIFPQDILYNDDSVLNFIANELIAKMNSVFERRKCGQCGAEYDEQADRDVGSFF